MERTDDQILQTKWMHENESVVGPVVDAIEQEKTHFVSYDEVIVAKFSFENGNPKVTQMVKHNDDLQKALDDSIEIPLDARIKPSAPTAKVSPTDSETQAGPSNSGGKRKSKRKAGKRKSKRKSSKKKRSRRKK